MKTSAIGLIAVAMLPWSVYAADQQPLPANVEAFLASGFGALHPEAPAPTRQFGQLVGVWRTDQEMAKMDGTWQQETPGLWAWKYTLDGFAVQDLWYQPAEQLPSYMSELGRDYMLTALRIYDARAQQWKIAWAANGNGALQGQDYGTFEAQLVDGEIVMSGPPMEGMGAQRVVFSDIADRSFSWRSEFSQDGGNTWITVMRVSATRLDP